MTTRKYLDSIDRTIDKNIRARHRRERKARIIHFFGCLFWCTFLAFTFTFWACVLLGVLAAAFYLTTGEFILAS
jgi:hypothetical protein